MTVVHKTVSPAYVTAVLVCAGTFYDVHSMAKSANEAFLRTYHCR
jgi:hypothetical protein